MRNVEILSPAGDMEKLRAAVIYGADAVYLSGTRFGMRTASGNFTNDELQSAVEYAHANGVRVFVTCNTLMRNSDIKGLPEYLSLLGEVGADAVIVSDMGCMRLAQKYAPNAEIHISTQASVLNYAAAEGFYQLGAKRICLARETTLEDAREICAKKPKGLEIEAFVHGAMCMAYSGRCMISDYLANRSPNRGNCAQPCRWRYALMEEKRPGEYFPVFEDGEGAHILNSKDLCMIEHIPELMSSGVDSFKIEGRVKSAYYCAAVTNAYRLAIDAYRASPDTWRPDGVWKTETERVSHRQYCTGFWLGEQGIQRTDTSAYIRTWDVVATVLSCDEDGNAVLEQKNKFDVGMELELMQPKSPPVKTVFTEMRDGNGDLTESARHAKMHVSVKLPVRAVSGAFIRRRGSDNASQA